MNRFVAKALISLNTFLALTAIAGGRALLAGFQTPPVSLLQGSPFRSYLVPGLVLSVVVGGSAASAAVALVFRLRVAVLANLFAAAAVIIFEVVEVGVIGSPAGPARNMQILYFTLGAAIAALALSVRRTTPPLEPAK
jgi:hypothetical protein